MKKPVILWGGTDVDSFLYGEKRSRFAQNPDYNRDGLEWTLLERAVENNTPVVGICRGAQLICAFNGGKLYQHSEPRTHDHSVTVCRSALKAEGIQNFERVSAGHHQIMRPEGNYKLLGWNPDPVKVWRSDDDMELVKDTAEVVWYPDTKMLAIQPHPEWSPLQDPFVVWLNGIMKELEIDYVF